MNTALHLFAALSIQVAGGTDVTVPAGTRLEVNGVRGSLQIETWERDEVEVVGRHSEDIRVEVKPGSTVEVQEIRPARSALERSEYRIRLPAGMSVKVVSHDAEISIRGIRADVDVNLNHGSIEVVDVEGAIFLDTTTGNLTITNSVGDVTLDATSGSITVRGLDGALTAETVAGTVRLTEMRSRAVHVTTNSGDVLYEGTIERGAILDFASQMGVVELNFPEAMSAEVSVGTVRGVFASEFDLGGVEPLQGETFVFIVGSGAAKVSVITFGGDIRIGKTLTR